MGMQHIPHENATHSLGKDKLKVLLSECRNIGMERKRITLYAIGSNQEKKHPYKIMHKTF